MTGRPTPEEKLINAVFGKTDYRLIVTAHVLGDKHVIGSSLFATKEAAEQAMADTQKEWTDAQVKNYFTIEIKEETKEEKGTTA